MRKPISIEARTVTDGRNGCVHSQHPGAQREFYEALVGQIPPGWEVTHPRRSQGCDTCVNVAHLELKCRQSLIWHAPKAQAAKPRSGGISPKAKLYPWKGETLTARQIGALEKINVGSLNTRLHRGETIEDAVAAASRAVFRPKLTWQDKPTTPTKLSQDLGLNRAKLVEALDAGVPLDEAIQRSKRVKPPRQTSPVASSTE